MASDRTVGVEATIGVSLAFIAAGLILAYAITATVSSFSLDSTGYVLIVVGAVGLLSALIAVLPWRNQREAADHVERRDRDVY
jgi:uncharacterized membrane protein YidH (DUF202 family)